MRIRRNSKIIIDNLLERIAGLKSVPLGYNDNLLEKIELELNSMTNKFPLGIHWDELVIEELDELEKTVADVNVDNYNPEEMQNKIEGMHGRVERINSILAVSPKGDKATSSTASKDKQTAPKDCSKSSDNWRKLHIEENILESAAMTDLQLSYDYLEEHLKLCLLCFAVFPLNSVVKKRPLIYWWIGEGLVTDTNTKTAEMVGEAALEELQKNGLIKPGQKIGAPLSLISSYTMHPWIHRIVISLARREGFFDLDATGKLTPDSHASRRVCFVAPDSEVLENSSQVERPGSRDRSQADGGGGDGSSRSSQEGRHQELENPSQVEGLGSRDRSQADGGGGDGSSGSRRKGRHQTDSNSVTLFNVNTQYVNIELSWFSRQTSVCVLQLGRWQTSATHHIEVDNTKFLEGLGAQKHLQYLSLRGLSRITKLPPDSIHKLITLKILDLRACHNLEELPSGIKAMKMLTHLDVSECYLLEQMPRGLDAFSHLQVLKDFVMCNSKNKDASRLKDLAKLEKLRKLSIIVGRDAEIAQDDFAHFEKLNILSITWGATESSGARPGHAPPPAQTKSIPPNLEKLDLRCFPEKYSPTWLRPSLLMKLKRLYIRGGKLGGLSNGENENWKVEILRLKFLRDFEMEWSSLRKGFPSPSYLEKKECVKLTSFQCDKHGVWVKN